MSNGAFEIIENKINQSCPPTVYFLLGQTHNTHTKQVYYRRYRSGILKAVRQWRGWHWGAELCSLGQERPLGLRPQCGEQVRGEELRQREQQVQKKDKRDGAATRSPRAASPAHGSNHDSESCHTNLQVVNWGPRCRLTCQALVRQLLHYCTVIIFCTIRLKYFLHFLCLVFYVCICDKYYKLVTMQPIMFLGVFS